MTYNENYKSFCKTIQIKEIKQKKNQKDSTSTVKRKNTVTMKNIQAIVQKLTYNEEIIAKYTIVLIHLQ